MLSTHGRGLYNPANAKRKGTSASREPLTTDEVDECTGKALQYLQHINSFSESHSSYSNSFNPQGCALTAPGRLRRLTFGFGRVRKITWSPGRALWLIVFLADKAANYFNMLVVTVYQTSQEMFYLRTKQSVQRPVHNP